MRLAILLAVIQQFQLTQAIMFCTAAAEFAARLVMILPATALLTQRILVCSSAKQTKLMASPSRRAAVAAA